MDSHGGWLASANDLARFAAALDADQNCCCLKAESLRRMYAPPAPPVSRKPDGYLHARFYGCGWSIISATGTSRATYSHNGSLPGTFTMLVRRHDGLSWVALFNQRSEDKKRPDTSLERALHRAADSNRDNDP